MTNSLAITIGLIVTALVSVDVLMYGTEHLLFLGKRLIELIEWLAFWR